MSTSAMDLRAMMSGDENARKLSVAKPKIATMRERFFTSAKELIDGRGGLLQEKKFKAAFERIPKTGKSRTIHFTLHGGRKVSKVVEIIYHPAKLSS
jgi:hypothetical protein